LRLLFWNMVVLAMSFDVRMANDDDAIWFAALFVCHVFVMCVDH